MTTQTGSSAAPAPEQLAAELALYGLRLRGSFRVTAADAVPALPGVQSTRLYLVGVAGSEVWPHFQASAQYHDGLPHPLDRWSRAIAETLAPAWHGVALFPSDGPPYFPFQRWADRCEPTHSSRMMLRIHPEYGLWHAYRFALVLPDSPDCNAKPPAPLPAIDLCLQCDGQPCLSACPVGAYTGESFVVEACRGHLKTQQGQTCMQGGCLARRACPHGQDFVYVPEHAAFHMQAFMPDCTHSGSADQPP